VACDEYLFRRAHWQVVVGGRVAAEVCTEAEAKAFVAGVMLGRPDATIYVRVSYEFRSGFKANFAIN
jgi:hypothetical protein